MNVLVFDIETVPDVEYGRALLGTPELVDDQVAKAMAAQRRQQTGGSEFLPLEQHRIVAIACAMRSGEGLKVWSLGDVDSGEAELVQRFFDGIERFKPDLVSWNGSGFDLPVLTYRAMRHGLQAAQFWETGDTDQAFRWNNYVNRYHARHTDLMDVLSFYQARARASLSDMALLLGLPGKLGFSGAQVWDAWQAGRREAVRQYCETDVLNTYLVYLRYQLLRGQLDEKGFAAETMRVRQFLGGATELHWREFLGAWPEPAA